MCKTLNGDHWASTLPSANGLWLSSEEPHTVHLKVARILYGRGESIQPG